MANELNHIISRFTWNTSFDEKTRVAELQTRLSIWSRMYMQREVTEVLNRICPQGQSWRIPKLELDLGFIGIDELEPMLAFKLRNGLHEKLRELILYAKDDRFSEIESIQERHTSIELLATFFLHGVMPWNYRSADGSVNEILAAQLKNNRSELIAMLRDIGHDHINVRKRIAWQVNEENIVDIIKGLEPNNSDQVIKFSREINDIQANETIVQAGSNEFRKNLWFWVLNYLLIDHGSAFNKRSFLKSSISQMAAHYNIDYDELLDLIVRAVKKATKSREAHDDFLVTLNLILGERKLQDDGNVLHKPKQALDTGDVLKNYFRAAFSQASFSSKKEFNELIIQFFGQDKTGFRNLVKELGYSQTGWLKAINYLDDRSLAIIAQALAPAGWKLFIEGIHFMQALCDEMGLKAERSMIRATGINYLLRSENAPINGRSFIEYFIEGAASSDKNFGARVFEIMMGGVNFIPSLKISCSEMYSELMVVMASVKPFSGIDNKKRVTELINELCIQFGKGFSGISRSELLIEQLDTWMRIDPGTVLQSLMDYGNKDQLRELLPHLFDGREVQQMVKYVKNDNSLLVARFYDVIGDLISDKQLGALVPFVKKCLFSVSLRLLLNKGTLSQSAFMEELLNEIYNNIPAPSLKQFDLFVYKLFESKNIYTRDFSRNSGERILAIYGINGDQITLPSIVQSINTSPQNKSYLADWLLTHFNDSEFVQLRQNDHTGGDIILNYFLPGSADLKPELTAEYASRLESATGTFAETETAYRLDGIFWKCILDYRNHKGNKSVLRNSFFKTVIMNIAGIDRHGQFSNVGSTPDPLKNNIDKLQDNVHEDRFSMIEECLRTGSASLLKNGQSFQFSGLIEEGINAAPLKLKAILKKMPETKGRLEMLAGSATFCQFSSWMSYDMDNEEQACLQTMRYLYTLTEKLMPAKEALAQKETYWKYAWTVINNGILTNCGTRKLVMDWIDNFTKTTKKNAEAIPGILKQNTNWLCPTVQKVFNDVISDKLPLQADRMQLPEQKLLRVEQLGSVQQLCYDLISEMKVPVWFDEYGITSDVPGLFQKIIQHYPVEFLMMLRRKTVTPALLLWLSNEIDFAVLINSIDGINNLGQPITDVLTGLYGALGKMNISGVSPKEMREILFKRVLHAWISGDRKLLQPEDIVKGFFRELIRRFGISAKQMVQAMEGQKPRWHKSMQAAFDEFKKNVYQTGKKNEPTGDLKPKKSLFKKQDPASPGVDGIPVKNAGLVLVSNYISLLFERLGVTVNNKFQDISMQCNAVHYLQYVVTGLTETEESLLPLNKVLCGLTLGEPVPKGIDVTENQQQLIEGLISAIIGYWPVIGHNTVNGFRGNWLVRNGVLTERQDKWELTVEKKAYDLLIQKSPFTFSVIKYPWMNKPLYVYWPY